MQQAARASDQTAFLLMGELVEMSPTNQLFTQPSDSRTEDYITGKFAETRWARQAPSGLLVETDPPMNRLFYEQEQGLSRALVTQLR